MYHDRDTVNEAAANYSAEHSTDRNANFLADCAATILEKFAMAKAASRQSLADLREVGEKLNEAKEALADQKGAFGKWAEALPFDKQWRARLMKLAAHWEAIIEAVEALPEDRRKWSVDGVLAIFAASEKAKAAPEGGEGGEGEGEGGEPKARQRKETEAERLRRELAEALAAIAALQAEVEALKGGKAKSKAREEKPREEPKAEQPKPNQGGATVDAATKARARKVWGLYTRPGTEGEGAAARDRLEGMAAKCGMDFDDFVVACGLAR